MADNEDMENVRATRREIVDKLSDVMDRDNAEAFVPFGECAECRWWSAPIKADGLGECALTEWDETDGHTHLSSKAKAEAGGHAAADFGCVQWERKDWMAKRGRPSISDEPTTPVNVVLPNSRYDRVDQLARELRCTPPEVIRRVLAGELPPFSPELKNPK